MVAKSSFECFATERAYKVRRSASCVSKNVIHIAFCLNCLKEGVRSTVDGKPRLRNYKYCIKKCNLVALLTTLLMFVVTQMIPQEILDLLLLIN